MCCRVRLFELNAYRARGLSWACARHHVLATRHAVGTGDPAASDPVDRCVPGVSPVACEATVSWSEGSAAMLVSGELGEWVEGQSVVRWLRDGVRERGDQIALRVRGTDGAWDEMSWREVGERCARFASRLRGLGVGPGDAVLLLLRNRPSSTSLTWVRCWCGQRR